DGDSIEHYDPEQSRCLAQTTESEPGNVWPTSIIVTIVGVGKRTALVTGRASTYNSRRSGRGAVWLARLNGVQEVAGSNPVAPTNARAAVAISYGGSRFSLPERRAGNRAGNPPGTAARGWRAGKEQAFRLTRGKVTGEHCS